MNQLGTAQSQPSLEVPILNSNLPTGHKVDDQMHRKEGAHNVWSPHETGSMGAGALEQRQRSPQGPGAEAGKEEPEPRAALDIRELSVEDPAGDPRRIGAEIGDVRDLASRKDEGSPEFRRR